MFEEKFKIAVKNMVCDRCISVIKSQLKDNNLNFFDVELGHISFNEKLSDVENDKLSDILKNEGFEIIQTAEDKIVNQIKTLVIQNIHSETLDGQKFSDYLATNIGVDYTKLSKLFSAHENRTIENYSIFQKIERAKELLSYNELTISQISYELNYSSPQHLSRQFKKVTGITPTKFKEGGHREKLDTI
ncbi:MAG: helix-turn-helix domain-containing protein [Fluviicola sp.]|nr:helix-turn-helix domain-containing protein [Fluviicola sp.]